jgi:hypothetical protein
MEAVRSSETSVDNNLTRQYKPEDSSEQKILLIYFKQLYIQAYSNYFSDNSPAFFV